MIKKVNVRTNVEIRNISTPIYKSRHDIELSTRDIRTCLLRGAYVYEILNDGSLLRLTLDNYSDDNNKSVPVVNLSAKKVEEPVVVSNPKEEEIPVITEAPVEEPVVEDDDHLVRCDTADRRGIGKYRRQ